MKKFRFFIRDTVWFCKESHLFIAPWTTKKAVYFPIAYVKFMKMAARDWRRKKKMDK